MIISSYIFLAAIIGLAPTLEGTPCEKKDDCKVMTSTNYRMEVSTISIGVVNMTSNRYRMRGTIGQPLVSKSKSTHYRLEAGFWPVASRKLKKIQPRPPS